MDPRAELRSLHRQLELADRAVRLVNDDVTFERLQSFAQDIKRKLAELERAVVEEETRSMAHSLWREAGCPSGRDLEFWLKAEWELRKKDRARRGSGRA